MAVFLLYILLVPLALPLVLSNTNKGDKFVKQHTFDGNTLPDCNKHMNSVLKDFNMGCKKCNSIILGDATYKTNLKEVTQVCTNRTNIKKNLFKSLKKFRVLECRLETGEKPPNCKYKKVKEGGT